MFADMLSQQPSTLSAPGGRADGANLYICRRMKAKRILRDMSQERLARALGISYQQLQRYESGKSRLPCSLLHHAALALDVPVSYFFDGIPADRTAGAEPGLDKDALLAARNIHRMPEGDMRKALLRLIADLAHPFGIDTGSR
jgi:transcriptional regulator with XRE-family HTH domain